MSSELFPLGQTVITANAQQTLDPEAVSLALRRHHSGDWGELCKDDWEENEVALAEGFRLFSVYRDQQNQKFYVITEHDRSITTILLPDDY